MADFVDIDVAAHPALPQGCVARWKAVGPAAAIESLTYEPDDGEPDGEYGVQAAWSDGRRTAAQQRLVEDSAAGASLLVFGGDFGLRLRLGDGAERAEAYLLIAP
mgnify:FL=1